MFYERLKQLCMLNGENITPLLKKLGMSTSGTGRWQEGVLPNGKILLIFADYFNVSVDYLLGLSDDANSTKNTINGNITGGIGIIHDVSGGTIIGSNGNNIKREREMTTEEVELLRIFNVLEVKGRLKILNLAIELEETHIQEAKAKENLKNENN